MSPLVSLLLLSVSLIGDPVGAEGTVVDANGNPVANAMVLLTAWGMPPDSGFQPSLASATTDAQGHFVLPGPPAEAFRLWPSGTIWAYRPGLAVGSAFYSTREAIPDLKIVLPGPERFVVALGRKDGRPFEGATVVPTQTVVPNVRGTALVALPETLAEIVVAKTDERGEAVFEAFRKGSAPQILQIRSDETAAQMLPAPDRAQVAKGRAEFVIEPAGSLKGRVSLGDGRAVEGIRIALEKETRRSGGVEPVVLPKPLEAAPDGSFESPPVLIEGGRYRVSVQKEGYALASSDWASPAGPGNSVQLQPLTLRALVSVRGRVVDRQGKPLAGVDVTQAGDGPARTAAKTDAEGRFTLGGYHAARGLVFAHADGFRHGGAILKDGQAEITLTRLTETPERLLKRTWPPMPPDELRELARRVLTPYLVEALKSGDSFAIANGIRALGQIDPAGALGTLEGLKLPRKDLILPEIAEVLAATDLPRARGIVLTIAEERLKINAILKLVDALPASRKADRVALLKDALGVVRAAKSPGLWLGERGDLAGRLAEEGEAEESRRAFEEGLSYRKDILNTPAGLKFTACLAGSRPEVARGLLNETDWEAMPPEAISNATVRLASVLPDVAATLFARPIPNRPNWPLLALEPMARADPARAVALLESVVEPSLHGSGRLLIAHGLAKTDPAEAERMYRQALVELAGAAEVSPLLQYYLQNGLPIVEEIRPTLAEEYLWFALSKRPPATGDLPFHSITARTTIAVAPYDTAIARALWGPIEEAMRSPSHPSLLDDSFVVSVLARLDPRKALEWIETHPGPGDRTRPGLAEILGYASRGLFQPSPLGGDGTIDSLRRRDPYR